MGPHLDALDDQTAKLITMTIFDKLADKAYGVGNIPGVQEFVGGAVGELAAQYGISTGPVIGAEGLWHKRGIAGG